MGQIIDIGRVMDSSHECLYNPSNINFVTGIVQIQNLYLRVFTSYNYAIPKGGLCRSARHSVCCLSVVGLSPEFEIRDIWLIQPCSRGRQSIQ